MFQFQTLLKPCLHDELFYFYLKNRSVKKRPPQLSSPWNVHFVYIRTIWMLFTILRLCVCVCVCYCVCKYVFISIYWLFFVKEFLLRWYWIISYGLKFLRRVPKSSNNFFNSLPWIFHYWSFSLYCLFKVACVVQIKLFFMDWFYYNLIIIIK